MRFMITILSTLMLMACSPTEATPPSPPVTHPEIPANPDPPKSTTMKITIGSATFPAILTGNAAATAFKALLPLTLSMNEMNNNEKYASLPGNLPTSATSSGTIQNGDLMLYGSSTLVLFYKTFSTSYSYTPIAKMDNPSGLQSALGSGSATVKFELE